MLTDVEGSTRLWEALPASMEPAIVRHAEIIAGSVERHGGTLVRERGEGDSTFSVFWTAPSAVAAAADIQRALQSERWPGGLELRVRTALHTGESVLRGGEYSSPVINRCARIRELAAGGQVLVSDQTANLAGPDLPGATTLRDLGPHRLRDLTKPIRLYQLCHPDIEADFPALRSLEGGRHNLPVQLTSFVGREAEATEVHKLLSTTRMLNLTGAGGIGKTRLALQVAGGSLDTYPDGVWFVDLAPLAEPALVATAVARSLRVREQPGRSVTEVVIDHLRDADALLILDNCEHVADAATDLANTLLRSCVELSVLATGREPLRISGAATWRVPGMGLPDPDVPTESLASGDGVRLFCERAALVRPDFALTHETGRVVASICRRLDGLPLAIELAAAAMRFLTPAQIEARLDNHVLSGGDPDVPRHQTMQATLDWSHDLLSAQEQILLRRLAVFAGGFTLEAVEDVCAYDGIDVADVLDVISGLVDKSLVVPEELGEHMRYGMLETVGQYAQQKLAASPEAAVVRDRHLDHFARLAHESDRRLEGPEQAVLLDLLETDHGNFRAALGHAMATTPTRALELGASLGRFWTVRGHWTEGRALLEAALGASPDASPALRARGLAACGTIAQRQGDLAAALDNQEEALATRRSSGEGSELVESVLAVAGVVHALGDRARAQTLHAEALEVARATGDDSLVVMALNGAGTSALSSGDVAGAVEAYEEAIAAGRRAGLRRALASPLVNLGVARLSTGDPEEAERLFDDALAIAREIGDRRLMAAAMDRLGQVAADRGELARARESYELSLEVMRELDDALGIASCLYRLGEIARHEGELASARRHLEESAELWRRTGAKQGLAATLHDLGRVDRAQGALGPARERLTESLRIAAELGYKPGVAASLDAMAGVLADAGDTLSATRLLGAAEAILGALGRSLDEFSSTERRRDADALRSALGDASFTEALTEGKAMSVEGAVELATGSQPNSS